MKSRPILGLTLGDPAGIGPELCLRALCEPAVLERCVPVVFGDASVINRLVAAGLPAPACPILSLTEWEKSSAVNGPTIIDCAAIDGATLEPGKVSAACGRAGYVFIEQAIRSAINGKIRGVVTAPIHKEALHLAGVPHAGHTEIFTALTGAKRSCMMLRSEELTVSMVTTHIGYAEVPGRLSARRILDVIELTAAAMKAILKRAPRLAVCGLNPHAGEHGLFGQKEEEMFVVPAVRQAGADGLSVAGPLPPDAAFTKEQRKRFDAIVTLYHDQGHIPFKMLAFETGVNVTLGLPIVRTSVDHGTAFDIAWRGVADPQSLYAAIGVAVELGGGAGMIGVIADDLSGAAELGAIGLRHGLRAQIVLDTRADAGDADLICVDTDSRSCDANEGAARARSAARFLVQAGARWIYKKTDSVLRGQIMAELPAVVDELHLDVALLVAANPSRDRVIREGRYYVDGRPIHETAFARDPEHPRKTSEVHKLLPGAQVNRVDEPLPASGVVAGEATTVDDLKNWAARLTPNILPAGAAEFFTAILAAREKRGTHLPPEAREPIAGRELFVCGSTSETTAEFVRAAQASGTPVFSLAAEVDRVVAAFETKPRVILNIGPPLVTDAVKARQLAVELADLAGRILERARVDRAYAEGGSTAAAVARRMGWSRLTVLREIAPGVAMLGVDVNPALRFTLKPGSYPWPPGF